MKVNMDAVMIVTHGLLNVVHTQQDCKSVWAPVHHPIQGNCSSCNPVSSHCHLIASKQLLHTNRW